jgi:hypothetical protein
LLVVIVAVAAYLAFRRLAPVLQGSGCRAAAGSASYSLDPEQASIAATIAGVAHKRSLPTAAVTIAYAAALQESKMHNLHYGDMDSVGVFQQRPSEGWGPRSELEDPVYATAKFFGVLIKVHNYLKLPVYQAAQAVQHSADGGAYIQYEQTAARLAAIFTGEHAHAVSCWSDTAPKKRVNFAAADQELARTFGPIPMAGTGKAAGRQQDRLRVPQSPVGWAVASWLVTHAASYGIRDVRYGGYQWQVSTGFHGWTKDSGAPPAGVVQLG